MMEMRDNFVKHGISHAGKHQTSDKQVLFFVT